MRGLLRVLEPEDDPDRFAWMRDMLLWQPPSGQGGCETFRQLGELTRHHIQLAAASGGQTRASESAESRVSIDPALIDEQTLEAALGGEAEVIASIAQGLESPRIEAYRSALQPLWAARGTEPRRRASARLALDRLGEIRPGTSIAEHGLPEFAWIAIPATPSPGVKLGSGYVWGSRRR